MVELLVGRREAGHPHVDKRGVERRARGRVEAVLAQRGRREVCDQYVSVNDMLPERPLARVGAQVERDEPLARIQSSVDRVRAEGCRTREPMSGLVVACCECSRRSHSPRSEVAPRLSSGRTTAHTLAPRPAR